MNGIKQKSNAYVFRMIVAALSASMKGVVYNSSSPIDSSIGIRFSILFVLPFVSTN